MISIHALREEGDLAAVIRVVRVCTISIHALREEGDAARPEQYKEHFLFLSTPSARRATRAEVAELLPQVISIHALREEGDLLKTDLGEHMAEFLSTPSARRATGFLRSGS